MTLDEEIKDRNRWHESIKRRTDLIERAAELGLLLDNPSNMKISKLKDLIDKAERWVRI